ncbi:MAG: 50S ribosomal protein L6 [Oscillospiraceae bacterium]|nr:50S ribosomal protein L6 [Oscillospiraceae bacterium]
MSRIGKLPINVPSGVDIKIDNNLVIVKGPKGEMKRQFDSKFKIELEDSKIKVSKISDTKESGSLYGLTRTLINNMVLGVTEGFKKILILEGVGYRAQLQGKKLVISLGYSHPVEIHPVEGITFELPTASQIVVNGTDKDLVGQVAANIRAWRVPEPYKGKGIRYSNEHIRRKEGKTGKK